MMHTPVYLKEVLGALSVQAGGLYIDATLGEGGHAKEIAKQGGRVLALDADPRQVAKFKTQKVSGVTPVSGNFSEIARISREYNFVPATGVLFDLGLSFEQLKNSKKGFSYKDSTEPLDMRLGGTTEQTAADILNSSTEDELYDIFSRYSEDVNARVVARQCIIWRKEYKFVEVGDFLDVINKAVPKHPQKSYARLFQALRIAVNDEFDNLRAGLAAALDILAPGGRLAVITFHSLEDRIVKRFIQSESAQIKHSEKIFKKNAKKFERSAMLRLVIKK